MGIFVMAREKRKTRVRAPRRRAADPKRRVGGTGSIVTNFRRTNTDGVRRAAGHQLNRRHDKKSYIDPDRIARNRVLIGTSFDIAKDVEAYLGTCARLSHKSAPDPAMATIILGASPEFFRPDGQEPGDEDPERVRRWTERSVAWIRETFGEDAVSAILNLDETTPHIHLAVVPTYQKRPRLPDRKRRGESDDALQARRRAAHEHPGVKTLSWSSSPVFGRADAFTPLRQSYAQAMAPLRLKYALDSHDPEAPAKPRPFKEWIDNRAHELDDAERMLIRRRIAEDECGAIDRACEDERRARLWAETERIDRETMALARRRAAEDECEAIERERLLLRDRTAFARRQAVEAECLAIDREGVETLRDEAKQARDAAERSRRVAEREAVAAQDVGAQVEGAARNLDMAAEAAWRGMHDEPITREHVADETQFEVLCAHAPERRPTRGFWYRFCSLHDPRTGAPLPFPEAVRAALERAFNAVAALARRMAALTRHEATHEQQVRDWNAGHEKRERTLDEAREAEGRLTETQAAVTEAEDRLAEIEDRAARAKAEASEAARTARRERDEAREEAGRLRGRLMPLRLAWDALRAHHRAVAEIEADRSRPRPQDLAAAEDWLQGARRTPHDYHPFEIALLAMTPEGWRRFGLDDLLGHARREDDPRAVFEGLKRLRSRDSRAFLDLVGIYQAADLDHALPPRPDTGEVVHRVALAFRRADPDGDRVTSAEPTPEAAALGALPAPLRRTLDEAFEAEQAEEEAARPGGSRP